MYMCVQLYICYKIIKGERSSSSFLLFFVIELINNKAATRIILKLKKNKFFLSVK